MQVSAAEIVPEKTKEVKKNIQAGGSESFSFPVRPSGGDGNEELPTRGKNKLEGDVGKEERVSDASVRSAEGSARHRLKAADGVTVSRKSGVRHHNDSAPSGKQVQQATSKQRNIVST
jgi:hypothetical protein